MFVSISADGGCAHLEGISHTAMSFNKLLLSFPFYFECDKYFSMLPLGNCSGKTRSDQSLLQLPLSFFQGEEVSNIY